MEDSILKCNICAKSFSGVVPYSQHMQSARHLKKQKQIESELLNELPTTEEGKLCCSTCDMKFSGVIPYTQHMNGSIHHKNIRRQRLMNDLYAGHKQNRMPQQPPVPAWSTNIEDVHRPHSSRSSPFDMISLQDELPAVPTSRQASGATTPSYTLWKKVEDSASEMNIPQVTQTEGRLKGCGICGISFFETAEAHIEHLESDEHFVKRLMSLKNVMPSANSLGDSVYSTT